LARTEFLDGAAATAAVEQMAQIAKQVLEKRKETPEARQPDPFNDAVAKLVLEMAKGRDDLAVKLAEQQRRSGSALRAG
jgi:non-homologous end joining protein Ku